MDKYKLSAKFEKHLDYITTIAMVNNDEDRDDVMKKLLEGFDKDSVIYRNMTNYGYLFWLTKISG